MNRQRQYIMRQLDTMKTGQKILIDRYDFIDAYPCGWPSIYHTPIEAFLSSMQGSAFGCWRVEENKNGDFIISKHVESSKRHYIDPDREYLFDRQKDGTYEIKKFK